MRINAPALAATPPSERQQRPLPFVCQTRPLDQEHKAAGGLAQTSGNVERHQGAIGGFCTPHNNRVSLPSVGLETTLLDRNGSTAGATVDTGSLQRDLRLEAVRPRAAPPSLSLKAVKFRPQNKQKWPMRQTARRMAR